MIRQVEITVENGDATLVVTDGWHRYYCKTMSDAAYLTWLLNQPVVHSLIVERGNRTSFFQEGDWLVCELDGGDLVLDAMYRVEHRRPTGFLCLAGLLCNYHESHFRLATPEEIADLAADMGR